MIAKNDEVHEINDKLTEDNCELIPAGALQQDGD